MGYAPGAGPRQRQILAHLNGEAVDVRELAAEILGAEMTQAQYNSINRAAHDLAQLGMVKITKVNRGAGAGPGAPRAFVLKVGRWLADSDGAAGTDAQVSYQQWLDRAWACFASDPAYAEEICQAALKLPGLVGDDDAGAADEFPGLEVQDVGGTVEQG